MNQAQFYCQSIKRMCNSGDGLLPSAYQQVEYLVMGANTCINLGVSLTSGAIGEMKINIISGGFASGAGAKDDTTSKYNRNYFSFSYDSGSGRYVIMIGAGGFNSQWVDYTFNTVYTVTYNTPNHSFVLNGAYHSGNYGWLDSQNPPWSRWNWVLHAGVSATGVVTPAAGETIVYYYKLSDHNNVLKRDLHPCYRKSDHKPGMYDLVTNTFFTNAGTGEFTVGNNI